MLALDRPAPARPKATRAGTHRSKPPEETLATLRRVMPALGITRLADVTGLDDIGLPVVQAIRPNSRSLSVSQGKGLDLALASASALMESIETWHAEHVILPLQYAPWEELRLRARVVDVDAMAHVRRSRFHPRLPMLWVEGQDLADGGPVWVPYEAVHLDMRRPVPAGSGCFALSSNGLAGGNDIVEATIHAVCELIERDATTLWALGGDELRATTRVDPTTVDDDGCRRLIDLYDTAGQAVGIWDITGDVGVACFAVAMVDAVEDERQLGSFAGYGCHLDRGVALSRALTEAGQSRLTHIAASRDDHGHASWDAGRGTDLRARARSELATNPCTRSFTDAPDLATDDLDADLALLRHRLAVAGLGEVDRVDLTRPEMDISVARVVIPGLEASHSFPTYAPGHRARAVLGGRS